MPNLTALRCELDEYDLDEYLRYYTTDRVRTGRHNQARVPANIIFDARKMGKIGSQTVTPICEQCSRLG